MARFPRDGARGFWSFWDGAGWSPDPASSARLAGSGGDAAGGSEPVAGIPSSVIAVGASYLVLSVSDDGREVLARLACSPVGPWGPSRVLHRVEEGDVAYLARAYRDGSGLLLAHSLAPLDPHRLHAQASAYLPRFLRVR